MFARILVLVLLATLVWAVVARASTAAGPERTYVVQPGDTLWSIAAAVAPDSDPRPVVDALREANGGRPTLRAGDRLMIDLDG
jgi:Tfp pilus assembly protein FimV